MITIEELLGRKAAGLDRSEDYIAWAVEELMAGAGSENVAILASMDFERPLDYEEVVRYFLACVRERGIDIPADSVALEQYTRILCNKIATDEIDPRDGLSLLARLYAAADVSDDLYAIWDNLEEDISLTDSSYGPVFNIGLDRTNIDGFIKDVTAQFLVLASLPLPGNFLRLTYCRTCGRSAEPGAKARELRWIPEAAFRFLFRRGRTFEQVCSECGSSNLLSMYDYEARAQFLRSQCAEVRDI